MSINGIQSTSMDSMQQMRKPPSAEEMAGRMAQSVEDGDIDLDTLVENLESRFGEDATTGLIAEDGTLDVTALTDLLAANAPEEGHGKPAGGMGPPPPPPPSEDSMSSTEELEAKLVEEYGSEAASAIFTEDGIDFEALTDLLTSGESEETGFLLNVTG